MLEIIFDCLGLTGFDRIKTRCRIRRSVRRCKRSIKNAFLEFIDDHFG